MLFESLFNAGAEQGFRHGTANDNLGDDAKTVDEVGGWQGADLIHAAYIAHLIEQDGEGKVVFSREDRDITRAVLNGAVDCEDYKPLIVFYSLYIF